MGGGACFVGVGFVLFVGWGLLGWSLSGGVGLILRGWSLWGWSLFLGVEIVLGGGASQHRNTVGVELPRWGRG